MKNEIEDPNRICINCTQFMQDSTDIAESFYGICLIDEDFEPFLDDIFEHGEFSSCKELYMRKRYDGEKEACTEFEEMEFPEDGESIDDFNGRMLVKQMQNENVDEILGYLYNSDLEIVKRAIWKLTKYFYFDNPDAVNGLIDFYLSLDPAENLPDVHMRKEVVEVLSRKETEKRIMEAFVNELYRSPSNNTTNQLYSLILRRLSYCPADMVEDLLLDLLRKKHYASRMTQRIIETIELARERSMQVSLGPDFYDPFNY